jgi:hypothetical protein
MAYDRKVRKLEEILNGTVFRMKVDLRGVGIAEDTEAHCNATDG